MGKPRSGRNREKLMKKMKIKAEKELEEKRFLEEFALIKRYNKMITQHMLEVGARPEKPKVVKRMTANSSKYEPMMPMLLTPEEIADSKGALRRLAVHKDNVHEILNRYQAKRVLNPRVIPSGRFVKKKYRTFVRIGSAATGVRVEELLKQFTAKENAKD